MNKAYIIDGNSLLFRAYYATSYGSTENLMRTSIGTPTNAIFAFYNMIVKLLANIKKDDFLFVAFDTDKQTFRHKEDANYKANRKPCPEELLIQMPIAREMLKALNIFTYEKSGWEADDLCGTVAKKLSSNNIEVMIYTSDKDFLQLIDKNISINILKTGLSNMILMNEVTMFDQLGITPNQIPDYKGLCGDASDNLPGIPGIGDKTAVKLLNDFKTLENIIKEAENMTSKIGKNILEFQEEGRRCKHLAIIETEVELPFIDDDLMYKGYKMNDVQSFAKKYELKQMISRLPTKLKIEDEKEHDINIKEITTFKDIVLEKDISICVDIDTGNYHLNQIHGLAIADSNKVYYIKRENIIKDKKLHSILLSDEYNKYCFDSKLIIVCLNRLNLSINNIYFDIMLAAYLLDSSLKNNADNIMSYFDANIVQNNENDLFVENNKIRCGEIVYYSLLKSRKALSELDNKKMTELFFNIEMPTAKILADIEIEGFPLDVKELEKMGEVFLSKANLLKTQIYEAVDCEFNIDSPKQVSDILFNKLGLKGNKKMSTSADSLKHLSSLHPVVDLILSYRKYAKLYSTYIVGIKSHVFSDNKLHAMFNQVQTSTGRLSSSEPNMQNISVREEELKCIRKAFYYKSDEYELLSLDYSQIELRILAELSNCESLKQSFLSGEDIHSVTAKKVFNLDNVTEEQRRLAKAINFGIIYGISDWGLAEQINLPIEEARKIIDAFYTTYPEISDYFNKVRDHVIKYGYVSTYFNRRRYISEINDSNYQVREFAKRAAMNAPIQGTAADLIKVAMIKIDKLLKTEEYKTKIVLQIHDELLFKVPLNEKDIVFNKIKDIMEHAANLSVKLIVNGGFAKSWYDTK